MDDCIIRKASEADYDEICALFAEGDAVHQTALPSVFRPAEGAARSLDFVRQALEDANALLLVAERGETIVGLVQAYVRSAPEIPILQPRRFVHVDTLIVAEAHRRQGIGKALMQGVETWAKEQRVSSIELNVWEFNEKAVRLYEELSYTTASRRMWRFLE